MPKRITKADIKHPRRENKNVRTRKVSGGNTLSNDQICWYDLPVEEVGGAVQQIVQRIDNNNYDLRNQFIRWARLYGNYEALGWANLSNASRSEQTNNRPVFNIIQSAVDTVHSKIAKDNPTPYFITSGADYFDKLKAEKQTQFVQGGFESMSFYDLINNKVLRDAMVYGLGGVAFTYDENDKKKPIGCEWIFIDELKIDQYDAQKGLPRSMSRCYSMQKEILLARFPDQAELIEEITTTHPHYFRNNDSVIELIVVTEIYHLATRDKPGRHLIILVDEVLLDEEYDDEEEFPWLLFAYMEKTIGIYGRGITESICSGQIEINKILMQIQQAQELQCSPLILVDTASQIPEDVLLVNNIARMIPIRSGTMPPQFISPQGLSQEVYQHLKDWMSWCYQEVGVSQTSVDGSKQPGVNSAIAMRTMVDIESTRYIQISKNWNNFIVRCAKMYMKMAKRHYEKHKDFSVTYMDKKSKILKEIPWSKINIDDDKYTIRCDTTSAFPQSAAGRIQTITEFISNNFIGRERGLELLGLDPDLEDEIKLQTSSLRLTEKRLCDMVEDKIYYHPEDFMNLKLSLQISEATYNQLCIDGCPEDRLALVRQWIKEITVKLMGQDPEIALLQQAYMPPPTAQPASQITAPQQAPAPPQQ